MSAEEKINNFFKNFTIKSPSEAKHYKHYYADFVELVSLFSNENFVTKGEILDHLNDVKDE